MAPSQGWYPDPTGQADLRFWNGEGWTRQTAMTPVAFAGAPAGYGTPAMTSPEFAPAAAIAPPMTPCLPLQRLPLADKPIGPPRQSSVKFYGLIAGAVAVVVGGAFAIPPVFSHHSKAASAAPLTPLTVHSPDPTAPSPASSSAPGPTTSVTYRLPAEFAGQPRITGARASQAEANTMKNWPVVGPHVFGIYGGGNGNPNAVVILQRLLMTPVGDAHIVQGMKEGLAGVPGLIWHQADAGDYGGAMQCGTTTEADSGGAICVFADATTFGMTFVAGQPADAASEAAQLRAESEPVPASPQPAAS